MFREAGLGPCQFRPRVVDGDAAGHIDEGNPGSDAQPSPGQCNLGRNLHPDSAAFTRTGHLSVPVEGSTDCRPAWGSQSRSGQFDATLFRSRLQFRHARRAQHPGLVDLAAAVIIAEVGVDMSRFPTAGHLCSWAKLSPGINTSAGKTKGNGSTGHGNRYLARILG